MSKRPGRFWAFALIALLLLTGCSQLSPNPANTPAPAETAQASPAAPTPAVISTPAGSPQAVSERSKLLVWLPAGFDPAGEGPASELLAGRLQQFSASHDGIVIEVRVKALEGTGGLLDALTTANSAAPLALPDLIALPQGMQETAALKGLLHPIDDLTQMVNDPDWYGYARELARLQTSTFGLPFAGDALVLVYRTTNLLAPPDNWSEVVSTGQPLIFAASDSQAPVTLAFYQSSGGQVRDDQGRPYLDAASLTQVLSFFQDSVKSGAMPFWLTQFGSDQLAWEAFLEQRSEMVITWSSRYLADMPENTQVTLLPTADGKPFTLATGWVWAMPSSLPARHPLSLELAEYLTEAEFLADWNQAAGYLPPRPSALTFLEGSESSALIEQVSRSAHLYPSTDVRTSLGAALSQATGKLLKQESDPKTAAQEAVNSLNLAAP